MKKAWLKRLSFVLSLIVLFGAFIFPVTAEGTETDGVIDGQVYSVVNVNSSKALDVSAGNTYDGSDVAQYTPTPSTYWQEWRIRYIGNGEYTIEDMHSRKLLTNSNGNAVISSANGSDAQKYRIVKNSNNTYTILSKSTNYTKALGILASAVGNGNTAVFLNTDGSNNQKFRLNLGQEYGIIDDRVYSFINSSDGKAIDVSGGSTATGAYIGAYTYYDDTPWQRWRVEYAGNGDYEIIDVHSGLLLSIPGSSSTLIHTWLYPRDNTDGQKFRFQRNTDGTVTVYSKSSDYKYALGWNGGSLSQLSEDNSSNQKFMLVLAGYVYSFRNKATGKVIDVSAGNTSNGSDVAQYQRVDGRLWQEWKLRYIGGGIYTIMDMHSGKYLSIEGSSSANDANAWIWGWDGTNGQKFRIQQNGDGTVTFRTVAGESNNLVLTLQNSTTTLVQWTDNGSNNQKFYITVERESIVSEGDYIFKNVGTSLNMARDNNGGDFCEQHVFSGEYGEQWELEYVWDGYYRIINGHNLLCLTAPNNVSDNQRINLAEENDSANQLWRFEVIEQGYFKIQSRYHVNNNSSLILSVGNSTSAGTNVEQQLTSTASTRGNWKLVEVNRATQDIFFLGIPDDGHDHNSCYQSGFSYLTSMEYDSINFRYSTINTAEQCIEYIKNSKVFISRSHGGYDNNCTWITIQGDPQSNLYSTFLYEDGKALHDLSNCELIVYIGCLTAYGGSDPSVAKNLITASVACGAKCALGFADEIKCEPANTWTTEFLRRYSSGESVRSAANNATEYANEEHPFYNIVGTGLNTFKIAD